MRRFDQLMRRAGRTPRLFPADHYDGWRGSGREIANRLIELIDWADEGGGTYYRDLSVNLVRLACTAPKGPPRSSQQLLDRLDRTTLAGLWAGSPRAKELISFKDDHVAGCRHRYQAFFDAVDGQLDGTFAFEDSDCGYLLLNELIYGEETSKLARLLLEDFKQYVAARKRDGHQVLLIVDEFSAIASGERVPRLVEIVRSYGASLVLAPQAYEGMGGDEAAARILNASHTIILHAVPEPEQLVRVAGTTIEIEASTQHDAGRSLDVGSARPQHQYKVSPNEVRALQPGGQPVLLHTPPDFCQYAEGPCDQDFSESRGQNLDLAGGEKQPGIGIAGPADSRLRGSSSTAGAIRSGRYVDQQRAHYRGRLHDAQHLQLDLEVLRRDDGALLDPWPQQHHEGLDPPARDGVRVAHHEDDGGPAQARADAGHRDQAQADHVRVALGDRDGARPTAEDGPRVRVEDV